MITEQQIKEFMDMVDCFIKAKECKYAICGKDYAGPTIAMFPERVQLQGGDKENALLDAFASAMQLEPKEHTEEYNGDTMHYRTVQYCGIEIFTLRIEAQIKEAV